MCQQTQACGILQVQECLDALAAGKEWHSTRQPQLLEDGDETEASTSAPAPALLMRLVASPQRMPCGSFALAVWYRHGLQASAWLTIVLDWLVMLLYGCEQVRHQICMQAMLAPVMSQGDVIREKGSGGLLDFVMGSAFGKGSPSTLIIGVMPSRQRPPAMCVQHVALKMLRASLAACGAGAIVVLLVLLLLKAPWRKSKQSPLLKAYRHD